MKIDISQYGVGLAIVMALAGLGLFLVAVKLMSSSMKTVSSGFLSKWLDKITKNKWMGLLFGIIFTTMIQSSDGTVALTIGLIGAGLLTLKTAIPLILGANIGTATTAIVVAIGGASSTAFEFIQYIPILVFIGAAILLFVKEEKKAHAAYLIFSVGAIFLGLKIMSAGMKAITSQEWFHNVIRDVGINDWVAATSNMALTGLFQSSSATVTVVQNIFIYGHRTIQSSGLTEAIAPGMGLSSAIAMILGANIGTTFTALISSIGGKRDTKRIAVVWLTTNIIMAIIFLPLLKYYAQFIDILQPIGSYHTGQLVKMDTLEKTNTAMKFQLSWAHLIFNTLLVGVFIWLTKPLEKWANYIIKEKDSKISYNVHLDYGLIDESTELAALSAQKSVSALGLMSEDSIKLMQNYIKDGNKKNIDKFNELMLLIDATRKAIFTYLVEIGSKDITKKTANKQISLILAIRSFERIASIGKDLFKEFKYIYKKGKLVIDEKEINNLLLLLKTTEKMTNKSSKQLSRYSSSRAKDIKEMNEYFDKMVVNASEQFIISKKHHEFNLHEFDFLLVIKYISSMAHHANRINKDRRRGRKITNIDKISMRFKKEISK